MFLLLPSSPHSQSPLTVQQQPPYVLDAHLPDQFFGRESAGEDPPEDLLEGPIQAPHPHRAQHVLGRLPARVHL